MNHTSSASDALSLPRLALKYLIATLLAICCLIVVSGRYDWHRAWIYLAMMTVLQAVTGYLLYKKSPDLLVERSRMQAGTAPWDKILAPVIAIIGPVAMWITAALDMRLHWPPAVPLRWTIAGLCVCLTGSLITAWAMLNNRFFSATVRLQTERGHVVVEGGPYHYVRHPGYSGALLFTLASPFALGSWLALYPAFATAVILVVRTALEDRTLRAALDGYQEFSGRTRWRLVPLVW